jgi:flagellar transcriptional activator FlhC
MGPQNSGSQRRFIDMLQHGYEMCELGARPPVLVSMFSGAVKSSKANQIYREVNNSKAPGGMLPHSAAWFVSTLKVNIQSTQLYLTYKQLLDNGRPRELAFTKAFKLYKEEAGDDAKLNIDRLWSLILAIHHNNELSVITCKECSCAYLIEIKENDGSNLCPMCKSSIFYHLTKVGGIDALNNVKTNAYLHEAATDNPAQNLSGQNKQRQSTLF